MNLQNHLFTKKWLGPFALVFFTIPSLVVAAAVPGTTYWCPDPADRARFFNSPMLQSSPVDAYAYTQAFTPALNPALQYTFAGANVWGNGMYCTYTASNRTKTILYSAVPTQKYFVGCKLKSKSVPATVPMSCVSNSVFQCQVKC
jgi:hypothetical protein